MDENTITTVFKADISQFSSSTQQLNQYIKTVNSEFDVATASLGKWSDSTDGLKAKITQLNKTLEAEKLKLQDMKKRLEEMEKAGKGNTKEAKNLQIAINKQTAVVKKSEKQTDDYTKSLEELEKAGVKTKQELKELTDAQEKQGKSAEGIASKIGKGIGGVAMGVAGAVTGAVGSLMGLAESTREFRKEQAQLETAFTQAGHSAETMKNTYSEFNAILGDTSKSQETMLHLAKFTKTEKELNDYTHALTGVFAEFGASLPTESLTENINLAIQTGDAIEGGLADALEWGGVNLDDFKTKLEACSTEEQRSQLILGKLTELYGESATAYKENNKDIIESEKAQTRLTQAMAELGAVAEPIMTMLKNLTADLLETIKPFVELIGTGLKSAFEGSTEGAKKFAEGITGLVEALLDKVTNMLPNIINIVVEMIPVLIESILNSIPTLITAIGNAINQILEALGQLLPQIVQICIDVIPQIIEALMNALPSIMLAIVDLITKLVEALPTLIQNLLEMIPQIIDTIIQAMMSYYPKLVEAFIQLLNAVLEALPQIIESLITEVPKIVNTIIDGLLNMLPVLLDACITLLMAIVDALPTIIILLVKEVPKLVTTIVKSLTSRISDITNAATELLMGIIEAIPEIVIQLLAEMPTIITAIVEGLLEGIPDMISAGGDLLAGLFEGLLNPKNIWNGVKSLFKGIVGGVEKIFKINSPSKVFEDRIGKNLALGISEGFSDEVGDVTKSMQKSLNGMTNDLEVDNSGIIGFGGSSTPSWVEQLFEMIKNQKIINNYKFDYKFEGMETSRLALHKAALETKRAIGG